MKLYLKIFLFLISIIIFNNCVNTKGFVKQKNNSEIIVKPLLQEDYSTALYKSKIDIGDKHFSGLFYFKSLADSSYRIVFLSEFGLNLLDMEYKNHKFEVKNIQDFLNKKIIINTLQRDLKLLIDIPQKNKNKIYKNSENQMSLVKYSKIFKKYYYFYSENKDLNMIIHRNGLSLINIEAKYSDKKVPQEMEIENKRIKLKIKFNLIKLK